MKIAVWDIHAIKKDGSIIHFEIIVPADVKSITTIFNYCTKFFITKGMGKEPLSSVEYKIHHREAATTKIMSVIKEKGYCIIEKEGCN